MFVPCPRMYSWENLRGFSGLECKRLDKCRKEVKKMGKCLAVLALFGLASLVCPASGVVFAQEEDAEYSWGTAKSVSSDQIVVMEYDYDKDEDVEVSYVVDPKVELKGVDSLDDIKVGDDIEVNYVTKDGKKVARVIAVEKPTEEED